MKSVVLFSSICMLVVACGGSSSSPPVVGTPKPSGPSSSNLAAKQLEGQWTTSLKADGIVGHQNVPLTLEVLGTHVLGKLGADKCTIDGQLKGNVLSGSWKEESGEGDFRWEFSPDGKSFHGTFGGMLHDKPVPEGSSWDGEQKSGIFAATSASATPSTTAPTP